MRDYHIHTTFCDGLNHPEEFIVHAISLGMDEIGFSAHSYTFFDESYCLKKERIEEYKAEITRLKEKYEDKISILLGIEQDYFSNESTEGYDYVIGSVHYVKKGDKYLPIDESEKIFVDIVNEYYGGDFYALAEDYYLLVGNVVEKTNADIIGHFDLVTKFNEGNKYFDVKNERYVAAYEKALDKLLKTGKVFEKNFGAIGRGYRTEPYPDVAIVKYIVKNGGRLMRCSDSHNTKQLQMFCNL